MSQNEKIHSVTCSNCLRRLCEVAFISGKPRVAVDYIVVSCYHCGDKSMPLEVTSRYLVGPATGLHDPEDDNSFYELTRIISSKVVGNKLVVGTAKWEENAK